MNDLDECYVCSHNRDEHHQSDPEMGNGCAIDDCDCFYFEDE